MLVSERFGTRYASQVRSHRDHKEVTSRISPSMGQRGIGSQTRISLHAQGDPDWDFARPHPQQIVKI